VKVLVCGGRDFGDTEAVYAALEAINAKQKITFIVTGDATGADVRAKWWAHNRCAGGYAIYHAPWPLRGLIAGPIRNQRMLDDNPDIALVVAFPGGKGTADMVRRARKKGIEIKEIGK